MGPITCTDLENGKSLGSDGCAPRGRSCRRTRPERPTPHDLFGGCFLCCASISERSVPSQDGGSPFLVH